MAGVIYLVQDDKRLVEMTDTPYSSEDLLQSLLADYPHLLAGDQINPTDPRRWLLVSREIGLPDSDGNSDRWSVDHLFLDQSGIPTIVEVKRGNDTRIRREVVGQMLEYAANAVVHWPADGLRATFEANSNAAARDPGEQLSELLGEDADVERFWQNVRTNLQAGRVRLIFVADEIPVELQRVVEFLSQQMDPAEVYAVEVKQFVGQGLKALVPRLVGGVAARSVEVARTTQQWDEESLSKDLMAHGGPQAVEAFKHILDWVSRLGLTAEYGRGAKYGTFYPNIQIDGKTFKIFGLWSDGAIDFRLGSITEMPPFRDDRGKRELLDRLNSVLGAPISPDQLSKNPWLTAPSFKNIEAYDQFLDGVGWIVQELRRHSTTPQQSG